jgi:hypothetical protein
MNRRQALLRTSLATTLALTTLVLLAGCLDKPAADVQVIISGDTVTFPAYVINDGELEAPKQGPYTKFAGTYPEHWPEQWQLDERFFTPDGAIPEALKEVKGTDAVTFEFDGAFHGTADEFEHWFREQAQALGIEITSHQLSTTFKAIERRKLDLPQTAWEQVGLTGEVMLNYGPRYANYTHFTCSLVRYLAGELKARAAEPPGQPTSAEPHEH